MSRFDNYPQESGYIPDNRPEVIIPEEVVINPDGSYDIRNKLIGFDAYIDKTMLINMSEFLSILVDINNIGVRDSVPRGMGIGESMKHYLTEIYSFKLSIYDIRGNLIATSNPVMKDDTYLGVDISDMVALESGDVVDTNIYDIRLDVDSKVNGYDFTKILIPQGKYFIRIR